MDANSRKRQLRYVALLTVAAAALVFVVSRHWSDSSRPNERVNVSTAKQGNAAATPVAPQQHGARSRAPVLISADGYVEIPIRFQLPGVERAKSASSYKQWIEQFPKAQQELIASFNGRHFGVYKISSPEQVSWMAANGYPMPEDIVAAQGLSDVELSDLSRQGNEKAQFLLYERTKDALNEKLDDAIRSGMTKSQFWSSDPDALKFRSSSMETDLMKTSSPFKGYIRAEDAVSIQDPATSAASVIAGLAWAGSLGDLRAPQFIETFIGKDATRLAIAIGIRNAELNASYNMTAFGCVSPGNAIPGNAGPVD